MDGSVSDKANDTEFEIMEEYIDLYAFFESQMTMLGEWMIKSNA